MCVIQLSESDFIICKNIYNFQSQTLLLRLSESMTLSFKKDVVWFLWRLLEEPDEMIHLPIFLNFFKEGQSLSGLKDMF